MNCTNCAHDHEEDEVCGARGFMQIGPHRVRAVCLCDDWSDVQPDQELQALLDLVEIKKRLVDAETEVELLKAERRGMDHSIVAMFERDRHHDKEVNSLRESIGARDHEINTLRAQVARLAAHVVRLAKETE